MNMQYTIFQILEFLHWEEAEMYDLVEKEGLFTEYINTFLKPKQHASGYPSHVQTNEEINTLGSIFSIGDCVRKGFHSENTVL